VPRPSASFSPFLECTPLLGMVEDSEMVAVI
jgi:hypothetical protein